MTKLEKLESKTKREKDLDRLAVEIANLVENDDMVREIVAHMEALAAEKTDKGEKKAWAHTVPTIKAHIMKKYRDELAKPVSRAEMAIAKRKKKVEG